jgi:hypothetical protein
VAYEVNLTGSDGMPVGVELSTGLPLTALGCNLSCVPQEQQPGATPDEQECALECCEDARIMSTCMASVPKDLPGAAAIGQGTPNGFEPYNPIAPHPNWGAWNPRFSTDPFHPRGPDWAGNLNRCLAQNECGDGKCDYIEATRCSCPADCGFGQGMPPIPPQQPIPPPLVAREVTGDDRFGDLEELPELAADIGVIAAAAPGVPPPGYDPLTNLPVGGIGSAKPYCPAAAEPDGICVRIVSEGRADGPADPDCPSNVPICTIRTEDLYETVEHAWLRVKDQQLPKGCGTTGQVFEIGYKCSDPVGFAAAKAWIEAWCGKPAETVKDPGVRGVCNIDPRSIYRNNTWDAVFNIYSTATDRCVERCTEARIQPSVLDCQNDEISRCEWWNACRAECIAGLGPATLFAENCGVRPVAVISDGGLAMACTAGTAQANAATVSTFGFGTVTCYDYSTSIWTKDWGASGEWQTKCTETASLNYPPGPNRDEQIRCCLDRMTQRCRGQQ